MSIINQTLRALDARQPDRMSPPPPPPAAGTRRNTKPWIAAAVLLPVAGLAIWFISRPAAESLPHPRAVATQHAVLPPIVAPASHLQPAPPAASPATPPVKAETPPAITEKQLRSTYSTAEKQQQMMASSPRLPAHATADLPGHAVMQQPAIR